ncbi:MAG TPA: hypothetical protein VFC63_21160 [Blastocatellia bacterium]|nr:hypothetical protein [Blastocatellia bacterium]
MKKIKVRIPPVVVVGVTAGLVMLLSVASSFSRRIGLVEPHVWIKTAESEDQSITTLSQSRALENTINGEVAHTAERLREASAVATAASLCAITEKLGGHAVQTVGQLITTLQKDELLPPGLAAGPEKGSILSAKGTLYLRYRPEPIGIEVLSLGADKASGPAILIRIPSNEKGEDGAQVFMAERLEGVVIPNPFASSAEVTACGWERQRLPEHIKN